MANPTLLSFSLSILYDGSLEILSATKDDEGVYTCLAENGRGRANSSGYLTITGQGPQPLQMLIFTISIVSKMQVCVRQRLLASLWLLKTPRRRWATRWC